MKKRILVVDDDEAILEAFDLLLKEAGFEVETRNKNGEYFLKKINKISPDLIILDVLLSGSDGRNICKQLKSRQPTRNIPIIMISAHPHAKDSALASGADDFLEKPFEMNELLEKIEKLISTNKS